MTYQAIRPIVSIDAAKFAKDWGRVSYARVGIAALIRMHLALAPNQKMSRQGIHSALRANTPYAVDAVDSVIGGFFVADADGLICNDETA